MSAPLRIKILKTIAHDEDTKVRDAEEDEVVENMKRLSLRGEAIEGTARHEFEAILEMRGRVLSIGRRAGSTLPVGLAERIGEGLICEMGAYVARPIGHLITREEAEARDSRPEWIVKDASHIAGLLHRVQKRGAFEERGAHPTPSRLRAMRKALVDDVISNYGNLRWLFDSSGNVVRTEIPELSNAMWDVYAAEFVSEADDSAEREIFSRYFEGVRNFKQLWQAILLYGGARQVSPMPRGPSPPDIAGSAVRQVREIHTLMLTRTPNIVAAYGTLEQNEKLRSTSPVK